MTAQPQCSWLLFIQTLRGTLLLLLTGGGMCVCVELLLDLPERTGNYTSFRSGFTSIRPEIMREENSILLAFGVKGLKRRSGWSFGMMNQM